MGKRKVRWLILCTVFFYVIATANDRMPLYLLAWLLASLLVVCYAFARFNAHGLRISRPEVPPRLVAGEPLPTALTVTNLGSVPRSNLVLADQTENRTRGQRRGRTVLVPALSGEATLAIGASDQTARRGQAVLGPVKLLSGDPLGFFEVERPVADSEATVLVHPRVWSLEGVLPLGGRGTDDGRSGQAPSGLELHSVRQYQPGDDLRHVHWKASARRSHLLVRTYERPVAHDSTLFLDLDARAEVGGSLDLGISLAASLAARLSALGHQARLVAHEDGLREWVLPPRSRLPLRLLDELAQLRGAGLVSIGALLAQQVDRLAPRATVVVLTAAATPELLKQLHGLADRGRSCWLVLLTDGEAAEAARRSLMGTSVRLSVVTPDDDPQRALLTGAEVAA